MKGRNSNPHGKGNVKIEKSNGAGSGKNRTYKAEVQIGEELVVVESTCKTFGGCFLTDGFQFDGECLQCKQGPFVQDLCRISNDPKVLDFNRSKAAKKGSGSGTRKIVKKADGKKSIKDFVGDCITAGVYTRKEIISMFLSNYAEHNESQGGRYVSSAFNAKYAIPRWGKLAKKEANGIVKWA